jgi:2-polyprenyl-6-methoxyphenol hydroxylase-like FAD-dependent oxidoreductase
VADWRKRLFGGIADRANSSYGKQYCAAFYNHPMAIDVCIRGAGVVGKALALLLARARIRVGLVQTAPPHSAMQTDIRAFALNAASKSLLTSLRAWPDTACAVQHMRVQGDADGLVCFDAAAMGFEALAWIVDASALEQRLQAAVSFAPEITLLSTPESAALTVICEGRTSSTLQAMDASAGLEFDRASYGQTAIAATLHTALPHQATAWQWMQGGEVCALLPRAAVHTSPGNLTTGASESVSNGNSVALVWSLHHAHAQQLLAMDEAQFCAALQHACGGAALGAMRLTSQRAAWPLHLSQASRWAGTGLAGMPQAAWALAGDAAHAVHPLAGQGLNLGLGDAAELAQVLGHKEYFRSLGDLRLLRRYERARKGDAAALRLATDGLQRLFAMDDDRVKTVRNWGMRSFDTLSPLKAAVMRRAMGI